MDSRKQPVKRGVVSFVLRGGRMNKSQRKAWDTYHDQFLIDLPRGDHPTSLRPDANIDWDQAFGRKNALICEIGSGSGDSLVPMASVRPHIDFIAFEVYQPAIASTFRRMGDAGISNIRVLPVDAVQGIQQLIDDNSLSEIWTFFPDPWHKTKHHKRRLIHKEFGELVATKLAPGGTWRLATDWKDYAYQMRTELDQVSTLVNKYNGWSPRFKDRPITKFEAKGLAARHSIYNLTYYKPRT